MSDKKTTQDLTIQKDDDLFSSMKNNNKNDVLYLHKISFYAVLWEFYTCYDGYYSMYQELANKEGIFKVCGRMIDDTFELSVRKYEKYLREQSNKSYYLIIKLIEHFEKNICNMYSSYMSKRAGPL